VFAAAADRARHPARITARCFFEDLPNGPTVKVANDDPIRATA
jgi:hypothetical protein